MPWADWSEWRELRDMVANGETRRACQRVDLYRLRRRNAVPITMISTVTLMRQLQEPDPDPYLQRLALSMTLTRLVNGSTDQLQPRGGHSIARSVYSLAIELKLPLILVEIRHQASHNALPRLSTLESAAKKALVWLDEYYWEPQLRSVKSAIDGDIEGVRKVFDAAQDEKSCEGLAEKAQEVGSAMPQNDKPKKDESLSVLDMLKALSNKLRTQEEAPIARTSSEPSTPRKPRWALCTDFESWKCTPLGLVPGQLRVPRINDTEPKKHPTRSKTTSKLLSKEQCSSSEDELGESAAQEKFQARGKKRPGSRDQEAQASMKKARQFSLEEETYIAKKRAEFESLAQSAQRFKSEDNSKTK